MNFGDLIFWKQLFGAFLVLLLVRFIFQKSGSKYASQIDRSLLLILSLYLFSQIDFRSLLFFLFISGFSYVGVTVLSGASRSVRYAGLAIALPILFLPLLYFKYSGFLLHEATSPVLGIGIPIGLSFYTFQKVAFFIDTVVRNKPTPRLLDFMNFAAFFPQLVAGPIERRDDLLPQMQKFRFRFYPSRLRLGTGWIIVGLFFKCVLADNLAAIASCWQGTLDNPVSVWLSCVVFGFRIYYDFAGYSLIALGLARCLGIRLTLNFRSPYLSRSIQEFWRRWHITLSQWFRDYIYIPMGGNRTPLAFFNILVVFGVSGLWHGAGWNFIIWGVAHGFLVGIQHLARRISFQVPAIVGWAVTNAFVCLLWLCFFETNLPHLFAKLRTVFSPALYSLSAFGSAFHGIQRSTLGYVVGVLALVGCIHFAEWLSEIKWRRPYRMFHQTWALCLMIGGILWFATSVQNGFIYFAF